MMMRVNLLENGLADYCCNLRCWPGREMEVSIRRRIRRVVWDGEVCCVPRLPLRIGRRRNCSRRQSYSDLGAAEAQFARTKNARMHLNSEVHE